MNRKNKKVSIIIPVYNGEQHLNECLDSIKNQTYSNLEIICINDGSKDRSIEILREYSLKDDRFIIVDQKNGGQSKARNEGIHIARGDYIAFVDCDDYIESTMIDRLVNKAEITDAEIVITNFLLYFEDTDKYESYRDEVLYYTLRDKVFTINDSPEIIKYVGVWDKFFRTDFIKKNNLYFMENMVYEDHLYSIEAEILAKKISLIPEHLYYYRKNAGESITDKEASNDSFKKDFLNIHNRIQEILDTSNVSNNTKMFYYEYFLENSIMHQRNSTNRRFYKWFFNTMRNIITEDKMKIINLIENDRVIEYAQYVFENKLFRCMNKFPIERK